MRNEGLCAWRARALTACPVPGGRPRPRPSLERTSADLRARDDTCGELRDALARLRDDYSELQAQLAAAAREGPGSERMREMQARPARTGGLQQLPPLEQLSLLCATQHVHTRKPLRQPPSKSPTQDALKQQDWKIERLTRDNRALEAANCELRGRVGGVEDENLQARGGGRAARGLPSARWRACLMSGCGLTPAPCRVHPQVSEKILALDEECRALRLAANEADARAEALGREKGQLQELSSALRSEVADKMALLDEFEAKFARQYRCVVQGGTRGVLAAQQLCMGSSVVYGASH